MGTAGEHRYCRCAGDGPHHHLVCRHCGHTIEIKGALLEHWASLVARQHGFTAVAHRLELEGECATCPKQG
ncbi:Fur family transcriptional regulator [Arthrobacter sp. Marseille-P9274]|uniref:Fur family transcriptional regulator n=1 Tax=Arthrobacter sp. Marseille-P9274 TaxID=2866572 RepID=UPI0021CAB40C|nr:transcriptional repressor [Arthrobacter sp. Marseille-P9274]